MAQQPKPEPGSPPLSASTDSRNLKDMNTSELIRGIITKFRMVEVEYEQVEKVLVARGTKYQAEIGQLRSQIEMERLIRIQAEVEFKREEQLQRGKRAQENSETLAKRVKKGESVDKISVQELRNKGIELESQNCKMKELEQKWKDHSKNVETLHGLRNKIVELELQISKIKDLEQKGKDDDTNDVAALEVMKNEETSHRLRKRNLELEFESGMLNELEKKWMDETNAVADLRGRVLDLEEEVKKIFSTIDGLRSENSKLVDEKNRNEGEPRAESEPVVDVNVNDEENKDAFDASGSESVNVNEEENKDAFGASGSAWEILESEDVEIITHEP